MVISTKRLITTVSFFLLFVLIYGGVTGENIKEAKFRALGNKVAGYAETSASRVSNAVVSLPEENVLVGLENGMGKYVTKVTNENGVLAMKGDFFITSYVDGIYKKRDPRLDAIVPIYVSTDSYGGSMYLVLFHDRGDAAIEKSYARLGGKNILLGSIEILPATSAEEEYRVHLIYKSEGLDKTRDITISKSKDLIIPVVDGHFDPGGTISK